MSIPADKIVLNCAIVTLTSTTAANVLPEKYGGKGTLPSARLLIGTSLTFIGMSMLADFAPGLAGPLSIIVATTALTFYGIPVADKYFNEAKNTTGANK
jgi:hypothetical protein